MFGSTATPLGIDFGTRRSHVCWLNDRGEVVYATIPGSTNISIPSNIAFDNAQGRLFGENAGVIDTDTQRCFKGVKRYLDNRDGVNVTVCNQSFSISLSELPAMFLYQLRISSEAILGHPVHDVVLSVPTLLGDEGRRAVCRAAKVASYRRTQLLSDPAALGIYLRRVGYQGKILLIDIGAACVSAAFVHIDSTSVELQKCYGWINIGGDRMDAQIVNLALARWGLEHSDVSATDMQQLEETARVVKEALDHYPQVSFPSISPTHHESFVLTRKDVFRALEPIAQRLTEFVGQFASDVSGDTPTSNVRVVLAGGASKEPTILEAFKNRFGQNVERVDRDDACAIGCAIHARNLWGTNGTVPLKVVDLMMQPLYVIKNGVRRCVVPSGSPYPYRFSDMCRNGESLEVHEGSDAENDSYLVGTVTCPLRAKFAKLTTPVMLMRNENGIVEDAGRRVRYKARSQGYQKDLDLERETSKAMAVLEKSARSSSRETPMTRHVQIQSRRISGARDATKRTITEITVVQGHERDHPDIKISVLAPPFPGDSSPWNSESTQASPRMRRFDPSERKCSTVGYLNQIGEAVLDRLPNIKEFDNNWKSPRELGAVTLAIWVQLEKLGKCGSGSRVLVQDHGTFTGCIAFQLAQVIGADVMSSLEGWRLKYGDAERDGLNLCFCVGCVDYEQLLACSSTGCHLIISPERAAQTSLPVDMLAEKFVTVRVLEQDVYLREDTDPGDSVVEYILYTLRKDCVIS